MPKVEYSEIIGMLDSTLLKPDVSAADVEKLCQDAVIYNFKSVVVNPIHVKECKKILKKTKVKVCTVAGFPLGEQLTNVKLFEAKKAFKEALKGSPRHIESMEELVELCGKTGDKAGTKKYRDKLALIRNK